MRILGIETSCDETSASIIEAKKGNKTVTLVSNIISSSVKLHAKTGGIIPENAAREQIKYILPVIKQALSPIFSSRLTSHFPSSPSIDAIAVTYGPGLIGSLLVGVETAKTLSYVFKKPIVPVNHLLGHIYANWINPVIPNSFRDLPHDEKEMLNQEVQHDKIEFPAVALLVSGGHTDLILMKAHGSIKWLGGTRDDAAGEALDKIGRLLGLSYPAGPIIEQLAKNGNLKAYKFPRPMIGTNDFDFSFSGLKTAVLQEVSSIKYQVLRKKIPDIAASVQQAICDVLIRKTIKAAKKYKPKSILLGGGVVANEELKRQLILNTKYELPDTEIFFPKKFLCTDNAAMIATAAFFNYKPAPVNKITANPELYFD
ncbi:MAG: tRNA (adenosine(37)-N6)-threonylcarbamoyltransferase complex transferase subunit TsaD [Candidatus Levybacteria bacterium RIFCSPLOWO2_12_FULL_37_7]|nr:MAG: tRNA (adenosine(37)-N6)-threonylcarbamoyltransferase complex transferase subunit TsaD [Candidatus Levybacteria bacterium RIFCSPLOWO2_12_FULL_37_7]